MLKRFLIPFLLFASLTVQAQNSYKKTLQQYQLDYVAKHEVVQGEDKKAMKFFPIDENYKVEASIEKKEVSPWFKMETSGPIKKMFRVYAVATFKIKDTLVHLNIYQSQSLMETEQYKEHLFIPFTDATSGEQSYISGRYIDVTISDIKNGRLEIDFNKAYNPYCAYVSGRYNCPIPPAENNLAVGIFAGEKAFEKHH